MRGQEEIMSTVNQLAELLKRTGLPSSDALELARDIARDLNDVRPGVVFGGTHADVVPVMWQRARNGGAQSLTLKLEVDDDGYHTRISVLERLERPQSPEGGS
jgi:hypothetical protein